MKTSLSVKQKITLTALSIGMFILSLAVSYAFFSAKIFGNESTSTIVGTAAYLELTFTDGNNTINGTNLIPGWSQSKTFSVENTGDATAYYKLKITNITNPLVTGGLWYQITSNDGGESIPKRQVLTKTRDISLPIEIGVDVTHNYTVTTYYDNIDADQSADKGKSFSYKISIESVNGLVGKPLYWDNPGENTLLSAIKQNYPKAVAPETIPGEEINVKEETVLAATEDDYGTSYYFRGNVQNNYITFAGNCWKIVRIDGNGNIKLLLWNNDNDCNNKNAQKSMFNQNINNNAYVGFMYGDKESDQFVTPEETGVHDNIHDSTILTNLKKWYEGTFRINDVYTESQYTSLLADVIWCGDKKPTTTRENIGIGRTSTSYGFVARANNPTLKCQDAIEIDVNNISRYTAYNKTDINNKNGNGKLKSVIENTSPVQYKYYKAGLITADEVTYAGGAFNKTESNSYYLYTGERYWTMTPYNFGAGGRSSVFYVTFTFTLSVDAPTSANTIYLRPSIALIPSVTLTDTPNQDGTKDHPFEVFVPNSQI